jgi:hypothetical protein
MDPGGVRFRIGLWSATEEEESSNYKELKNLVDTVREEVSTGRIKDCELFMFTDNSTAESCFYWGSSKSTQLHALVLELRVLEITYGMMIHVIHVSGTRMIAQGMNGCLRGSLMEGVMTGQSMLSFVDLAKTAVERRPPLLAWIIGWIGRENLEPLTLEGWFVEGHRISGGYLDGHKVWMPSHEAKNGLHLWAPQPPVADAALKELLKAQHKRTNTFHVVVIPRLMSPWWRRLFNKACDFAFVVSPGPTFWPAGMHEPLLVGIVLPFSIHRPWCFKRAPLLVEMGRNLREVLAEGQGDGGDTLRKLLKLPRLVASMPEHMACGVLHHPGRTSSFPDGCHRGRTRQPVA